MTDEEASGGVKGHNVRYVLAFSLIAAIVDSQRRAVFADVDLPFSVEVTDPVSVPDRSSGPKALLVMVGAIFLGLAISVFWIVYREFRAKPPMPRS